MRSQCDISDSVGALLAVMAPLSLVAVELGAQVACGTIVVMSAASSQVTPEGATRELLDEALDDLTAVQARLALLLGAGNPAEPATCPAPPGSAQSWRTR